MCRHKGYTPEKEEHISRWNLEDSSRSYADDVYYASAYMQPALTAGLPVIMRNEEGQNISVDAFWGVLPPWKHSFKEAVTAAVNFVNIRSETVYESKLYAPFLKKKQRCLIPCSYYYEHHHFDTFGKKSQLLKAKDKVPFLIETRRRPLFAVPALYSHWFNPETKARITTYSMLTIVSNELLSAIHNGGDNPDRMPLVIERGMEETWLNPNSTEQEVNKILNFQIHSDKLNAYPVAPLTGSAAKTGEYIIKEYNWEKYAAEIEEIKNAGKSKTPVLQDA